MRIEPGETHTRQLGESLWLLTLRGEHDLSTVPDLEAAFARVESSGTTAVIDVTRVTFVDSSVIGLLIREHKRGENLLVVAPTGCRVRRLVASSPSPVCCRSLKRAKKRSGQCPSRS